MITYSLQFMFLKSEFNVGVEGRGGGCPKTRCCKKNTVVGFTSQITNLSVLVSMVTNLLLWVPMVTNLPLRVPMVTNLSLRVPMVTNLPPDWSLRLLLNTQGSLQHCEKVVYITKYRNKVQKQSPQFSLVSHKQQSNCQWLHIWLPIIQRTLPNSLYNGLYPTHCRFTQFHYKSTHFYQSFPPPPHCGSA